MENPLSELKMIIEKMDINTLFQPIISLTDGDILGYEALSRGPLNSIFHSPSEMFKLASENSMVWELERACRQKAIMNASKLPKDKLLFINVDPIIIKDEKFKKGFTTHFLSNYNIGPSNIVFEITERSSVKDFESYNKALTHYKNQGFKIAIDDMGSGYSGLRMLYETKPAYVKIDMELIRDIHIDSYKQSIIKALVSLCSDNKMYLIAEGIETVAELLTLIELGVDFGQGYFLSNPDEKMLQTPITKKQLIFNTYIKSQFSTFDYPHKNKILKNG